MDRPDAVLVDDNDVKPERFFRWLNARRPAEARRRFGKLYWEAWTRVVQAFLLFMFGLTFLLIGGTCMAVCTERDRGIAFFFIGLLMFMPGAYGALTLLNYVRCFRGYHYQDLP